MSGVIKAAVAQSVRPLHLGAAAGGRRHETTHSPLPPAEDPRIARLAAEVEALRREIAAAKEEAEKAVAKAREDGRREGMLGALRDDEKRIEALAGGIAAATAKWEGKIEDMDRLAAVVSRTALSKLFARPDLYGDFVASMVARQIQHLRRESILAIHVSSVDFPDEAALAAFSVATGTSSIRVSASADLAAGECRIDLQLGHVDVGPRAQWPALAEILDEMLSVEAQG